MLEGMTTGAPGSAWNQSPRGMDAAHPGLGTLSSRLLTPTVADKDSLLTERCLYGNAHVRPHDGDAGMGRSHLPSRRWAKERCSAVQQSAPRVVLQDEPGPGQIAEACLAIRFRIECALIIPMIIQQVGSSPLGADQIDVASNVSRAVPSGSVWSDCNRFSRNRKVEGSNPSRRTISPGQTAWTACFLALVVVPAVFG